MDDEVGPGIVPEHLRIRYEGEPVVVTVDGQDFRVRTRAGGPVTYDFDWLNGPHDYGFAISGPDRPMDRSAMEKAIRDFLAEIDPRTGYLKD